MEEILIRTKFWPWIIIMRGQKAHEMIQRINNCPLVIHSIHSLTHLSFYKVLKIRLYSGHGILWSCNNNNNNNNNNNKHLYMISLDLECSLEYLQMKWPFWYQQG